jgi:hypothetical protein
MAVEIFMDGIDSTAIEAASAAALTGYDSGNGVAKEQTLQTVDGNVDDVEQSLTVNVEPDLATIQGDLSTAQAVLDALNQGIIYGAAETGTLSTTQATTNLTYGDNQLMGRVIIVLTGDAAGEVSPITDNAETGGLITFEEMTTAMADGDLFKII